MFPSQRTQSFHCCSLTRGLISLRHSKRSVIPVVTRSKLPVAPFSTPDQALANQRLIFPSRLAGRLWLLVARYWRS